LGDFDRSQAAQMVGHELAVEQPIASDPEARDQPGQSDLRGVLANREHALAEEGRAEIDPVKAADQLAFLPAFDRMGVASLVELIVGHFDLGIDPGLVALGAAANDVGESGVAADVELAGAYHLAKRS
jgi:hypothetical protein